MYLDSYGPRTTREVVEDYIGVSEDWINHIKAEKGVDGCYPFNVEPTIEMAELLEKKVLFMKNELLTNMVDMPLQLYK